MRPEEGDDSRRILVPVAVALAAIMFVFPLTIPFPLLDPDEGLHASIAQEMVERGNWSMPQFLGQPFLDKPIFFFWVQAGSLRLFGPSEMAVRLPGLMFGLLGVIATGLLGGRMFGSTAGLIAGILYATTILPTALTQAAAHDVALIPSVTLAILLLWEAEHALSRLAAVAAVLGAGVFLGLAILTKGLLGAGVVGTAYGAYLLVTLPRKLRSRQTPSHQTPPHQTPPHCNGGGFLNGRNLVETTRAVWRIGLPPFLAGITVLIVAVLIASPWYALVERQNPGYLRYFFLERHVKGFATWSQPHGDEPWWYYLPVLLGGGLPWIAYLPVVVQDALTRRRDSGGMPLLWSWLIGWTLLMAFGRLEIGNLRLARVSGHGRVDGNGLAATDRRHAHRGRPPIVRADVRLGVVERTVGAAGRRPGDAGRICGAVRLAGLGGRGYCSGFGAGAPDPLARRPVASQLGRGRTFGGCTIRGRDNNGAPAGGRDLLGPRPGPTFQSVGPSARAAIGRRGPPRLAGILSYPAASRRIDGRPASAMGGQGTALLATGRRDRRARAQGRRAASVSPLRGRPVRDGGPLPAVSGRRSATRPRNEDSV